MMMNNSAETSVRLAVERANDGNRAMVKGDYLSAMHAYTESIQHHPDYFGFHLNRALCYIRLDYHYLALLDSNQATKLAELNPKCYFVRSKILKKLNQFEEAELDLSTAARLAPDNEDIQEELTHFKENEKDEFVLKGKLKGYDLYDKEYYKVKVNLHSVKAHKVPTNLWGYHALRIENIEPSSPNELIYSHFSLFGDIKKVKRMSGKNITIDFSNPIAPMFCIAYFQGKCIPELCIREGDVRHKPLKLYFAPASDQHGLKFARPKHPTLTTKECYYWRTTSCTLKTRCNKLHIPANKNVDTQVWMKDMV